jgi:hypothetical protein
MAAFFVYTLAAIGLVSLIVVLVGLLLAEETYERDRIESEVRSAERRLHDIARNTFEAMLAEARNERS